MGHLTDRFFSTPAESFKAINYYFSNTAAKHQPKQERDSGNSILNGFHWWHRDPSHRVMSKWVIRTWPKVSHSLFNKLNFKIRMWFPEGNTLPAQRLGFPLQGRLPGVAPTLSLFQGEVTLSSVLEVFRGVPRSWHTVIENPRLKPRPNPPAALLTKSQTPCTYKSHLFFTYIKWIMKINAVLQWLVLF